MRETNQKAVAKEPMSVEEYIQYELTAECRHEYINGQLFEMPGEKRTNLKIARRLSSFFVNELEEKGYEVYTHEMKVSNLNRSKYYYPDVVATKEPETEATDYIQYQPEIIAEIISPGSRTNDLVDKYIEYTKIPSLNYYLIVEPELTHVTVHAKNEEGKWEATLYSSLNDVVPLPLLETSLPLNKVYG